MISLQGLLGPEDLAALHQHLGKDAFVDGAETAHGRAKAVKHNLQLPEGGELEARLGRVVVAALERHDAFRNMVLPVRLTQPRFSRYEDGMTYGWHVDGALMNAAGGGPLRSDLACTVFLSDPASYEGGELAIQTSTGQTLVKLPAGDALVYPATTVHRVQPITAGVRLATVLWVQSMIADERQRQLVTDLLRATGELRHRDPQAPELERLLAVRENLIRMWGQP